MLHFTRAWSNSEESGKWNCVSRGNGGMSAHNIVARKSDEGSVIDALL